MTVAATPDRLTVVVIDYKTRRRNHRLLFGAPRLEIRRGWRRRLAAFSPGDVFGYERWRADQYGTQDWRFYVCQCAQDGSLARIPGVLPGAEILLSAYGKTRVKRTLSTIDYLKTKLGPLENISPEDWRAVHNAIAIGEQTPWSFATEKGGKPCSLG